MDLFDEPKVVTARVDFELPGIDGRSGHTTGVYGFDGELIVKNVRADFTIQPDLSDRPVMQVIGTLVQQSCR